MKLENIPFDGLFTVYQRNNDGTFPKLFHGFAPEDVPDAHKEKTVIRMYPFNESIIVEVKED